MIDRRFDMTISMLDFCGKWKAAEDSRFLAPHARSRPSLLLPFFSPFSPFA